MAAVTRDSMPSSTKNRDPTLPRIQLHLGDSITDRGSEVCLSGPKHSLCALDKQLDPTAPGFGHLVQLKDDYKHTDIVIGNWGFGGWTTQMVLHNLAALIPKPDACVLESVFISFGANDSSTWIDRARFAKACTDGTPNQAVAPSQYRENLAATVRHIRQLHGENTPIALVTPTPVRHEFVRLGQAAWVNEVLKREHERAGLEGPAPVIDPNDVPVNRSTEQAEHFAKIVQRLGEQLGVPVVNTFTALQKAITEAPTEAEKDAFFTDGLHLSNRGYRVLYSTYRDFIATEWPDQTPEKRTEKKKQEKGKELNQNVAVAAEVVRPRVDRWQDVATEVANSGVFVVPAGTQREEDVEYYRTYTVNAGRENIAALEPGAQASG